MRPPNTEYRNLINALMEQGLNVEQAKKAAKDLVQNNPRYREAVQGGGFLDQFIRGRGQRGQQGPQFKTQKDIGKIYEELKLTGRQVVDDVGKQAAKTSQAASAINPSGSTAKWGARAIPLAAGGMNILQGNIVEGAGQITGGITGEKIARTLAGGIRNPIARVGAQVFGSLLGSTIGGQALPAITGTVFRGVQSNPSLDKKGSDTQIAREIKTPFGTVAFNEAARQDARQRQLFEQEFERTERLKRLNAQLAIEQYRATNEATMQFNHQNAALLKKAEDQHRNRTAQLMNQQFGIDAGLTLLQNQGSLARQGMATAASLAASMSNNPYAAALR